MQRTHYRISLARKKKFDQKYLLYLFCLVILFWALFDGVVTYLVPIVITESGLSKTMMGVILGTSSIAGALFDFIACRIFGDTYYKKFFILMFGACLTVPLILYKADTFLMFVLAMILWGIYYDFKGMGIFNFIGNNTPEEKHTESFSLVQMFLALGYLISPLLVGFLIAETLDWKPFVLAWIFIGISIVFFAILLALTRNDKKKKTLCEEGCETKRGFLAEMKLWKKIGKIIKPVLFLTFLISLCDAFFWTVGPLVSEELIDTFGSFSGIFMMMYVLPSVLAAFMVGHFTRRLGKKRAAALTLFAGAFIILLFAWMPNPYLLVVAVFFASLCVSLSLPAINGAYADYISESAQYEKEIEGLQDFYTNLGYVIGPMTAGFIADYSGNFAAFTFLGFVCSVGALLLLIFTPKSINLLKKMPA